MRISGSKFQVQVSRFGFWGLGFTVQGAGCRAQGSNTGFGVGVGGLGFRAQGLGLITNSGLGFSVQGLGFSV